MCLREERASLQEGWVIANHILVAFHVAFISSVLALPHADVSKGEVLRFIFVSPETAVSALFMLLTFHCAIAAHELGHFLAAARLEALSDAVAQDAKRRLSASAVRRWLYVTGMFLKIPYGLARGVKREGLSYYPDAPFNLAVAAAGPRASRDTAAIFVPLAVLLLSLGLAQDESVSLYAGRLCLGIGLVSLLDFLLADPGKYRAFREQEQRARSGAAKVGRSSGWLDRAPEAKRRMLEGRVQQVTHPKLGPVTAPWQFRNCGMGGRHTEKEYPESNISMQEAMFLILGARDYLDAQELTVRLQNRLKEIIEAEEGCRVMGIGLEGGLAPYIDKGPFRLPELRLWTMMTRAIEDCGLRPGLDVAIALDPAMSELEIAYREERGQPDAIGTYLFWRDKSQTVLDRDGLLALYREAIEEHEVPILSIEDGFSEHDTAGWKLLLDELGDRIFVIGDDLVTTNDRTIEEAADRGLINCALIKANQIGTLYETVLAMLVALGKGLDLVVSHRSKSPNDDMEAQIALAVNALGLKAGGGANTERLVKYQAVAEEMLRLGEDNRGVRAISDGEKAVVRKVRAYEEPTNAGIPTVGATVEVDLASAGVTLAFRGSTPLGTSAGTGEAIHLVDAVADYYEHREEIDRHPALFEAIEPGIYAFKKNVNEALMRAVDDEGPHTLFARAQRYRGKGCLNAVDNVRQIIAPHFEGRSASALTLRNVDKELLALELRTAVRRGRLDPDPDAATQLAVMQRKANLGMNAILSVSLAMGRAIAHLRGKQLYELLREEMLTIIDRLAAETGVAIAGNRLADYIVALQAAAEVVRAGGEPLHSVLRRITGLYDGDQADIVASLPPTPPIEAAVPSAARQVLDMLVPALGQAFSSDPHHGLQHAEDILHNAARLATLLDDSLLSDVEVDWRILAAASCLHDLGTGSGELSARLSRAEEVLASLDGFPADLQDPVLEAIALNADRRGNGVAERAEGTVEARLFCDAHLLENVGVKGIYRALAGRPNREPTAALAARRGNISTATFAETRQMAADGHGLLLTFLRRLGSEGAERRDAAEASSSAATSADRVGPPLSGARGVVSWIRGHADSHPVALADEALALLADRAEQVPDSDDLAFSADYFTALRASYHSHLSATARLWGMTPASTPSRSPASDRPPAPKPSRPIVETVTELDVNEELAAVSLLLFRTHIDQGGRGASDALRDYRRMKREIARRSHRVGIINNRFFVGEDRLIIPYIVGDDVVVHEVRRGRVETIATPDFVPGTIFTDATFTELTGFEGKVMDLEKEIFVFDADRAEPFQIRRIEDLATLLHRASESTNRNEAVYWLRLLVARLCNLSPRVFLGAKNLQPEVSHLTQELIGVVNGRLAQRLPALIRILVRNLPGLVGKPNLIDRLWNDTIDLAEVHVRGSAIVNELRRSGHHALGERTLLIGRAYLAYLRSGSSSKLRELGFAAPARADREARTRDAVRVILERVVADLETLLGTSEIVTRIDEWRRTYGDALLRCAFGKSLGDELETLLSDGVRAKNRWVYYHHLRILMEKAEAVTFPEGLSERFVEQLAALHQLKPDEEGFDAQQTEQQLRATVRELEEAIREAHLKELSASLDGVLASHHDHDRHATFLAIRRLRQQLVEWRKQGGFVEKRFHLAQLDCLLEEMGYLAVRHIAGRYSKNGVDLQQCLGLIRTCALNLAFDGLLSREIDDLTAIAIDPRRSRDELIDALATVERCYHKIRQRVTLPYERMRGRLGLSDEDLRIVLANMQRYMHDLNSMVQLSDFAIQHLRALPDGEDLERPEAQPPETEPAVLHLSHRDAIDRLITGSPGTCPREAYGGKGSGLLYISHLNIPTRDGFIIPTTWPRQGIHLRETERLAGELTEHLTILEQDIARREGCARRFGDAESPMLLAVRGGSVFSMPGILSTVVFVGLNDEIADRLAEDGPWTAYDSYRRFLASYAAAVWGVRIESFDLVEDAKRRYGVAYKKELPWEAMKEIAQTSKAIVRQKGLGKELDEILAEPSKQLLGSVSAVFRSWTTDTARRYRDIKGMCHSWHTAAIVQEMAFGNRRNEVVVEGMDERAASLTGVIPRTYVTDRGFRAFEGEFKFSAAGDDLVGGVTAQTSFRRADAMRQLMPMLDRRLGHVVAKLRRFMGTDQELEFTVDHGVLSVLQARMAASRADEATDRFDDPGEPASLGLGVRGGAFRGLVAFDDDDRERLAAIDLKKRGDVDGVLMVLENPTPDDIPMIISADGLLTAKGGSTSHAAVAVNGIEDRPYAAIMSVAGLRVNPQRREALIMDGERVVHRIRSGEVMSIQGTSGEVYIGSRRRRERAAD